jgi:integrase
MSKDPGNHIVRATVSKIFKKLALAINMDAEMIGSHSGRKTGATLLIQRGVGVAQLKDHGRWKSDAVYRYYAPNFGERLRVSSMMLEQEDA